MLWETVQRRSRSVARAESEMKGGGFFQVLSFLCQTGGGVGPPCGALLRGGGGEERHGRGGHLQDFRDRQ